MKIYINFEILRYLEGGNKDKSKIQPNNWQEKVPQHPMYHNFQSTFYMLNNYVISRMVSYSNSCLTEILI
jgi:hypothetical protein